MLFQGIMLMCGFLITVIFFDVVDREFKGINYFGYFWRHYAYFFGYKRYIKSINNEFTDYVNRRMEEEI